MSVRPVLSLEIFAEAMAQIESSKESAWVLAKLNLSEAAWTAEVEAWDGRIADDLAQGGSRWLSRYQAAYLKATKRASSGEPDAHAGDASPMSLERYVEISMAMSGSETSEAILESFGISAHDWDVAARAWSTNLADDQALLGEWQRLVSNWPPRDGRR